MRTGRPPGANPIGHAVTPGVPFGDTFLWQLPKAFAGGTGKGKEMVAPDAANAASDDRTLAVAAPAGAPRGRGAAGSSAGHDGAVTIAGPGGSAAVPHLEREDDLR
ncbi:hypothetical protein Sru01_01850 [Sphaerisporangium rufum]|uniref:Uncharacterized protein n=1 Tax=Sphaerisporangium rufum TaxID=1381558 RepID=A0A919QXR1_9ACTN|nr:hypothetical protein Sru01_01850 [Sphaerisporangium rufum]